MTHIIAVSNQKGGVAKTTSCLSVGACLAELGFRTLVVDLDPQAHLTMAAGLDPDSLPVTLVDLLDSPTEKIAEEELFYPTVMDGLDILPADLRLANSERRLGERDGYEQSLLEALNPWLTPKNAGKSASKKDRRAYDYMLLDCPPSMGTATVVALTAAQVALVPVQCEYFASRGLMRLLDVIEAVKTHTNPGLDYRLFASMFDSRTLISRRVLDELRSHFGERMLATVIRQDARLRESPMAGEPVLVYAPRTRASEEYRSLTAELIKEIEGL